MKSTSGVEGSPALLLRLVVSSLSAKRLRFSFSIPRLAGDRLSSTLTLCVADRWLLPGGWWWEGGEEEGEEEEEGMST